MEQSYIKKWTIGDVTVTRVAESSVNSMPPNSFVGSDAAMVSLHEWLKPDYVDDEGNLLSAFQAFVVEAGDRRIIVDTCVGNDKVRNLEIFHMLNQPFLERLERAGFPPETIDTVFCTHLHVDHVGWNTRFVDGQWVPTFPNARYLFARTEYEYWSTHDDDVNAGVYEDSVKPIIDAGLATLIDVDHRICDEVWLEHSPGHTPGHCSVRIASKGAQAVITGDMVHHPLQCAEPQIHTHLCWDPDKAGDTRRDAFDRWSREGVLVIGSHFTGPGGGFVEPYGKAWKLVGGLDLPRRP